MVGQFIRENHRVQLVSLPLRVRRVLPVVLLVAGRRVHRVAPARSILVKCLDSQLR